ncbi:MAG: tetratricopeptide repeat protein, partial [Cyclobacteriaceae bacterium]
MKHLTILFFLATNLCYGQQDISLNAQNAFDRAEYEDAFALFTAAAEEHIREDEPVAYVQCNLMMAECKVLMGEPYEGNQLAENTIAYLDRYFPEQNIVRGQALTLQGRAFLNLGRYDLALEYLEKARTLLGNEKTLELAQCLNDLGVVHLYSGNFELSRQNLEQSLSIRRTILSSTDLPIGDSFNNLGLFHQETDNPLQALIFYNRAKKIYEDKYGIDHPKTVLVSNNLAFAYASQGEFDEALNLANE